MYKISTENKDIGEKLNVENIYDLIDKEIKDKFKTNLKLVKYTITLLNQLKN